jgi:CRISPR/Cas system CSM-associated protein Csm3 (group 7 of RAMP superfamily)
MAHGTIILTGTVELLSSMLIGSGKDDITDIDVLVDKDKYPFIPATSLIGVLRRHINSFRVNQSMVEKIKTQYKDIPKNFWKRLTPFINKTYSSLEVFKYDLETALGREYQASYLGIIIRNVEITGDFKRFWGFTENIRDNGSSETSGCQSSLRCSDLHIIQKSETDSASSSISSRDGVKIDSITGMAKEKGKFAYQVVEPGATFHLYMEADYDDHTRNFTGKIMATIQQVLKRSSIQVGAKTRSGLGNLKLQDNSKMGLFDFSKKTHVLGWLKRDFSVAEPLEAAPLLLERRQFKIRAHLELKQSMIIRSYHSPQDLPGIDAWHMTSNSQPVIPGSSLKGALRARAEKILNTLEKDPKILDYLFGKVVEPKTTGNKTSSTPNIKAVKGKIKVAEIVIPKELLIDDEVQSRIKIDRFTGGTISTALFNTMPLFAKNGDSSKDICLEIIIDGYRDHEAGLMLLVLKDLWSGDLAVGGEKNIGRGVFQGINAHIHIDDQEIFLENDISKLPTGHKQLLESLVQSLNNYEYSGEIE